MLVSDSRTLEHSESIQMEIFSSSIQSDDEHSPDVKENDEAQPRRKAYAVGIGLLLVVVFLWTSSNFVTQVC
jgi:solute carrier family 35 protein F5